MLIDGDAIEAELRRKLELVEVAVVELMALLRIEIGVGQHHPGGAILFRIAHVEVGIRHQMEQEDLHASTLWMNCETWSANFCGCSICAKCAQPGRMASVEPAMRPLSASA